MPLQVYNSLTRRKEEFRPLDPERVGIYVCGPTVYGHCHVGHAKSYVAFDVIIKWLRRHWTVRYVQNITDVGHLTDDADQGEDKIGRHARLLQRHPLELVDEYMRSYFADMEALGVAHPNMYVRATQHIGEQIEQIERLIANGHAYVVNGNVYFDVASWPEYGCLSGRNTEESLEGSRIDVRQEKRDPRDFALWKSAEGTAHILRWRSPWSVGYPGWHIECSAMAMKYLGGSFDIHGGGNENKFPHHECEIAQARASGDGSFARYWLHNNMINVDGQKMGKSLGNAIGIKDVLAVHRPAALRLFLLQTHYSRPSNYTAAGMQAAEAGVDRIANVLAALGKAKAAAPGAADASFSAALESRTASIAAAMDDDFDTPIAIAELFEFVTEANKALVEGLSAAAAAAGADLIRSIAQDLLGIIPAPEAMARGGSDLVDPLMSLILDLRAELRAAKNWKAADMLRDRLGALSITVEDSKDGSTWSKS